MRILAVLSIAILFSLSAFAQSIVGGAGNCSVDADPNTITDLRIQDAFSECLSVINSSTGEEWIYNGSLPEGSRWVLQDNTASNSLYTGSGTIPSGGSTVSVDPVAGNVITIRDENVSSQDDPQMIFRSYSDRALEFRNSAGSTIGWLSPTNNNGIDDAGLLWDISSSSSPTYVKFGYSTDKNIRFEKYGGTLVRAGSIFQMSSQQGAYVVDDNDPALFRHTFSNVNQSLTLAENVPNHFLIRVGGNIASPTDLAGTEVLGRYSFAGLSDGSTNIASGIEAVANGINAGGLLQANLRFLVRNSETSVFPSEHTLMHTNGSIRINGYANPLNMTATALGKTEVTSHRIGLADDGTLIAVAHNGNDVSLYGQDGTIAVPRNVDLQDDITWDISTQGSGDYPFKVVHSGNNTQGYMEFEKLNGNKLRISASESGWNINAWPENLYFGSGGYFRMIGTEGLEIPSGGTSQRPSSGATLTPGVIRYNVDTDHIEGYTVGGWKDLDLAGGSGSSDGNGIYSQNGTVPTRSIVQTGGVTWSAGSTGAILHRFNSTNDFQSYMEFGKIGSSEFLIRDDNTNWSIDVGTGTLTLRGDEVDIDGSFFVPASTTANRPAPSRPGEIFYDTNLNTLLQSDGVTWSPIGGGGGGGADQTLAVSTTSPGELTISGTGGNTVNVHTTGINNPDYSATEGSTVTVDWESQSTGIAKINIGSVTSSFTLAQTNSFSGTGRAAYLIHFHSNDTDAVTVSLPTGFTDEEGNALSSIIIPSGTGGKWLTFYKSGTKFYTNE